MATKSRDIFIFLEYLEDDMPQLCVRRLFGSVSSFFVDAVNRLQLCPKRGGFIMPRPRREKHTTMSTSPVWASPFYLFNNMHDNKGPNTKFFVKRSLMYPRGHKASYEMDVSLMGSVRFWIDSFYHNHIKRSCRWGETLHLTKYFPINFPIYISPSPLGRSF